MAVYGLGRQLTLAPLYALIGAGAFATMPEVVLQSTSAQNDLVAAAFTGCAVYFIIDGLQRTRVASLALSVVALGLGVGTKPTAFLIVPGVALGALALLWTRRESALHLVPRPVAVMTASLLLASVVGGSWYIGNWRDYGSISGPPEVTQLQQVAHPSLITLVINLVRHANGLIDPAGPAFLTHPTSRIACGITGHVREAITRVAHIPPTNQALEWPGTTYSPYPSCSFSENGSWFGLAGMMAMLAAVAWFVTPIIRRRPDTAWLLAAGSVSWIVCASLLLRWQPWEGRLLCPAMVLSAPLLGLVARSAARRPWGRWAIMAAILYTSLGGLSAALKNPDTPIRAWAAPRTVVQVQQRPLMGPVLDQLRKTVPDHARLGVYTTMDDWIFPLFGPHLDRVVVPLVLPAGARAHPIHLPHVEFIVTHQTSSRVAIVVQSVHGARCHLTWSGRPDQEGTPWSLYRCTPLHG